MKGATPTPNPTAAAATGTGTDRRTETKRFDLLDAANKDIRVDAMRRSGGGQLIGRRRKIETHAMRSFALTTRRRRSKIFIFDGLHTF